MSVLRTWFDWWFLLPLAVLLPAVVIAALLRADRRRRARLAALGDEHGVGMVDVEPLADLAPQRDRRRLACVVLDE